MEAKGRRAIVVRADHGFEDGAKRPFRAALHAFGHIDVLMNTASVHASGIEAADIDIAASGRTLRNDLIGQPRCCERVVRHRRERGGGGRIIDVTSVHEDIPDPGGSDDHRATRALRMLTRALSIEVAGDGINVDDLAPGTVLTPFSQAAIDHPQLRERQVQRIPLKRAAQPEEVARPALLLASVDSDHVTGSADVMDGGPMRSVGQGASPTTRRPRCPAAAAAESRRGRARHGGGPVPSTG